MRAPHKSGSNWWLSGALSSLLLITAHASSAQTIQSVLSSALQGTPAVAVVVDVPTGRQLAVVHPAEAENLRTAPGSLLKPLFLAAAMEQRLVQPGTAVFCRRNLHITAYSRDWDLACAHPQTTTALAAKEALAYSCNRYFADLADRIPPEQATAILEHYGLSPRRSLDRAQKELLVLGLAGITVSPGQMAIAYRKLALRLKDAGLNVVRDGLRDSVSYGMAHNAELPGMEIAGKTGTAADTAQGPSHGWFAGVAQLRQRNIALVIYLPHGNGADAASLAQHFLRATQPPPSASARALTVELFSTQARKTLTATGADRLPLQMEWKQDGLHLSSGKTVQQLTLSGIYRMEDITAAGQWTIAWRPDRLRVLLTLPSEDYVAAALSGEAAPGEPLASLKAMAISTRTFALENADRHRAEGFGLCDSTHCQALRLGQPRPEVERAVHETAGETLWFRSQRAHVYYTQHCGGMSEAADAVWPAARAAYLPGGHADPYCLRRSAAAWHARLPLTQLRGIFRQQGWPTPFPIEDVRVIGRTATGRAAMLAITGRGAPAQISASSFRFAVDRALGWNQVRSDWFAVSISGNALEIDGRGYGHGVGLCQAGAYQMAAEGHSETDILGFYFPGANAGITPQDHGWRQVAGAGWTLLTSGASVQLLQEGNAAWARSQALFGSPADAPHPTVQEMPTTELFRQTTHQPGWMLASTRGHIVFLQPLAVRQPNGGTQMLLLHEFLHVLVEQQAGQQAPLWLREGLVEALIAPDKRPVDLSPDKVDAELAHPTSAQASRHAHKVAGRMVSLLDVRYGMAAVRAFLRNGMPAATPYSAFSE